MRRDKSHSGAFTNKLASCLTSSSHKAVEGFGTFRLSHDRSCRIHSLELVLLVLLLVLLAMVILPGWTSCRRDNIGLLSLILSDWEYVSYITVLCVQGIPILSLLIFMPSLYSHSNLNIYLYIMPSCWSRGWPRAMRKRKASSITSSMQWEPSVNLGFQGLLAV